jgi:hypothetical protein
MLANQVSTFEWYAYARLNQMVGAPKKNRASPQAGLVLGRWLAGIAQQPLFSSGGSG